METKTNSQVQSFDDGETIDLLELAGVIWRKIWLVIIGFVVGAVIAFLFTKFLITPQYEAKSIIYIFSKTTSITSITDLQIGSSLTEDYRIIATTRDVVEPVISSLELDTTYEQLCKTFTVTNPDSSHMLYVTVKNPDPELAAKICNALSERIRNQIAEVVNTDKPSMVERAVVPTQKSSPSTAKNTAIGAMAGAIIVAAFIVLNYMLDDTINTREDVQKYLGLDTLAAFPIMKNQGRAKEKEKPKRQKADKKVKNG